MTWFSSIAIAVLTAVFSAVVSWFIAARAVVWYRISPFEGGSSYFVIFIALAAFVGGLILGLIIARVIANGASASGASASFARGLGFSLLLVSAIGAVTASTSRMLADVPPTLHGEELMLLVEVRYPTSHTASPATDSVIHIVDLGALSGNTLRVSKQGPLWTSDARLEDGQWIVPGAVEVFTSRGKRVMRIEPELSDANGLMLPLSASPRESDLQWSEWIPRARAGAPALPDEFSYRYKVTPRSQPSHIETIGAFQVATIASSFFYGGSVNGNTVVAATATFTVRYHGKPFTIGVADSNAQSARDNSSAQNVGEALSVSAVATLAGEPTALLVLASPAGKDAGCYLLEENGERVRSTFVSRCSGSLTAEPLTNDESWRRSVNEIPVVQGRVDRERFMHSGTYLFEGGILDAAKRVVRKSGVTDYPMGFNRAVSPIGISPNGLSYVRLGFSEANQSDPALLVFNTNGDKPNLVSIDRAGTRFPGAGGLNAAWLAHYYEWQHVENGVEHLSARAGVKPLPYRGALHNESGGGLVYRLHSAKKEMVDTLAAFLIAEFGAKRKADDEGGHSFHGTIDGIEVTVFDNESTGDVVVFLAHGSDTTLLRKIAAKFDVELATGKYDGMFAY